MPSSVIFNIENAVFISGAEPTFGHTGSCFHISGSGMHDVTGLRFSDAIGNKIQLDFSTGLIGAVQTVTGCVPEMAPQDLLTIEAYNSISTGTYKYFEVGEENCVHKCNVEITGTLKVGNIPYFPAGTGFLVFDSTDGNKVKYRGIDVEAITGFSPAAITLTAGSGLVGGGDLTAPRRFDVVAGTGIHVDDNTVNVDSGQLLTTGQGFFNVNKKGLTGDSAVYFFNGEALDLGVADGTGIIVNQNSVDINTGLVITTGDAYFNVNAGPGLTGDIKVYLKETLDLGVFVDGDTIQFTGAGDDSIAAFTVVDGGITPEKVSFGFAGSDTKSGAANSVKSPISGGTGIAPFVYSGLTNATIDLSGVPNAALETTGIINFNLLDGITGSSTVSLGEQATFGLRADIQETGYLSGGSGIQGFKYTGIESYDINILAGTGIHVDYSGVNVKVNTGLLISQDEINVGIGTGIYLDGKELNVRNTRGFISGGSGIQDFGFSGDENQTINIQVGTGLSINDDIVNVPVGTGIHLDGKELNVKNTRGFISGGSGIQDFGFSGDENQVINIQVGTGLSINDDMVNVVVGTGIHLDDKELNVRNTRGFISGGSGIQDFKFSGDENQVINISLGTGLLISDDSIHIDTGIVALTGINHFDIGTSSGLITGDPRIEMGSVLNLDVGAGSGIIVDDDFVNVNTGFVLYTGDAYFNVNAAQGLTGDTKVYMGDTLDLGVYADNVTIGFTGGGDQIAAFKVLSLQNHLSGGSGLNDFTFSGDETLTANIGAGTGIIVDSEKVHVNTGFVLYTGDAFFNVNPAHGLTGDTRVYMGDTLDLGVFADGVTIGFTGAGDEIAAFKVLSLQNHLSGGSGLNDFVFSGDQTLTANVGAGTGIIVDSEKVHVNSGQVVLTSGDQTITGIKTFSQIEVVNLLRASGSGIIVNNLHVTESITGDGDAAKVLTENAINISGLTFSEQRFTNAHVEVNNANQVPLANLTQSAGIEVCTIDFAARQLGNIISAEVELNLSALDIVDLHIMLFVDDETTPRRVWIQQVYSAAIGEVFQGMYFFSVADTNSHTYKVRVARAYNDGSNGEFYINRYYGSTSSSSILIEEIQPDIGAGIGSI